MANDEQTTYEMLAPDGNKYRIPGPPGASDEAVRNQIIAQHPHLGDPQFLSDPYLKGFDPHREERGAAGGIYKRAAAAFPGSVASNVEETAGALWTIATNPKQAASALWDMGLSGVASTVKEDLAKHYGSMDRVQRTFEEDPARFLMDALSVGTGGAALLRKLAVGIAKVGRAAIPKAAGTLAEVEPEALRAAGEAGAAGGQAAKEYKTGLKTFPQTPGQTIPYYQEAGEALTRGPMAGWMPRKVASAVSGLGGMGAEWAAGGLLPHGVFTGAAATGVLGSSPRLAGATMYGLGAMERRAKELPTMSDAYAAAKVPANRAVIRADAQAVLKDKERKNQLEPDQIKTLRKATRPDADSNAMLAAQRVLTPLSMGAMLPKSPQERINIGHMAAPSPSSYGGMDAGRLIESTRATAPQTPAPGQPSQPRSPAVPTPPAQMQAPPIGPIEKPSSRFADKLTELWEKALKGISPISEARADPLDAHPSGPQLLHRPPLEISVGPGAPGSPGMQAAGPGVRLRPPVREPTTVREPSTERTPWSGAAPHEVTPVPPTEFVGAISKMQETPHGGALDPPSLEHYGKMRTYTTPDKTAGFALDGNNIVGVFKLPNSPLKKVGPSLISSAVAGGGRRLDAFDTMLPWMYGENGFRAVARVPFDPKQAPPNWNYEAFKQWNGGKPDLVMMVYDPYRSGYRAGDGKPVKTYEEAMALQQAEAAKVAERMQAAEKNFDKVAQSVTGLKGMKEFLTPQELETVTQRNTKSLLDIFKQMPGEEMAAVAYSGRAKRGWYKQSAKALVDVFGVADAPRFTALLAAMSPRVSVERDTINALRTWNEWNKAGRPTDHQAILQVMARAMGGDLSSVMAAWRMNAIRALTHEDPLHLVISGPKVNSFFRNLAGDVHEVTNDAWMASYAGVEHGKLIGRASKDPYGYLGTKSPTYVGMSAAARRAAKILSNRTKDVWTPAEIQETVWSWAKTLKEKSGKSANVEQLLRAGDISHEEIANTPDFATLFTKNIYAKILQEGGYGKAVERLGSRTAGSRRAASGTPLKPEAGTFTEAAFKRHLLRAGRRLDLSSVPEAE